MGKGRYFLGKWKRQAETHKKKKAVIRHDKVECCGALRSYTRPPTTRNTNVRKIRGGR